METQKWENENKTEKLETVSITGLNSLEKFPTDNMQKKILDLSFTTTINFDRQ